MAFVREDIPTEYKKKYNIELADVWQIDKERDAIFYYTGGNFRGTEKSFILIWKEDAIEVGGEFRPIGLDRDKIIEWHNVSALIPEYLRYKKYEILCAVKEALEGLGFLGMGEYKTTIFFDPKMNFKESI